MKKAIIILFTILLPFICFAQQSFDGIHILKSVDLESRIKQLSIDHEKQKSPEQQRLSSADRSLALFYAFTQGTFTDTVATGEASNKQNSPATIGLKLKDKLSETYQLNTTLYFSYMSASFGDATLANDNLTIPMEWSLSMDLQRSYFSSMPRLQNYLGMNIEKISTFNIDELSVASELQTRQQTLFYLYLGIAFNFHIFKHPSQLRAAGAMSLFTSESRPSLVTTDKYAGSKINLSLETQIGQEWSLLLFYNQSSLTGATQLSIQRMGLGLSYML